MWPSWGSQASSLLLAIRFYERKKGTDTEQPQAQERVALGHPSSHFTSQSQLAPPSLSSAWEARADGDVRGPEVAEGFSGIWV